MIFPIDEHTQRAINDVLADERDIESDKYQRRLLREYLFDHLFMWPAPDGKMTIISVAHRPSETFDDGKPCEFGFRADYIDTDDFGGPSLEGPRYFHMNGGIINHGTSDDPDWSIHT